MFLLAVLYDLQSPDNDGHCIHYTTQETCEANKSFLDYDQNSCRWKWNDELSDYGCTFNEVHINFKIQLYCTILVSVFNVLINNPMEYLFMLLTSPSFEKRASVPLNAFHTLKKNENVSSVSRRVSRHGRGTMISIQTSAIKTDAFMVASNTSMFIPMNTKAAYRRAKMSLKAITANGVPNNESKQDIENESYRKKQNASELCYGGINMFSQLLVSISYTRKALISMKSDFTSFLSDFDSKWGIDSASGEFLRLDKKKKKNLIISTSFCSGKPPLNNLHMHSVVPSSGPHTSKNLHLCVSELLKKEIDSVQLDSQEHVKHMSGLGEDQAGIEILHLFIQDLLGRDTAAAKIFRAKTNEDYAEMPFVSHRTKVLLCVILIVINAFFVYFSILRGYQKGMVWQKLYVRSCILQAAIDIVFNQTIECLYIHYFVPRMVPLKELKKIRDVLDSCIDKLCTGHASATWHRDRKIVDAPKYLFVSRNVAMAYPMLMESMLVASYHTHLPGEFENKWKTELHYTQKSSDIPTHNSSAPHIHRTFAFGLNSLLKSVAMMSAMVGLQFMAAVPLSIQKLIVRFCEPLMFGGMVFTWLYIRGNTLAISFFVVALAIIVIVIIRRYRLADDKKQQTLDNFVKKDEDAKDMYLLLKGDEPVNTSQPDDHSAFSYLNISEYESIEVSSYRLSISNDEINILDSSLFALNSELSFISNGDFESSSTDTEYVTL
jgi:hypothetical protein